MPKEITAQSLQVQDKFVERNASLPENNAIIEKHSIMPGKM